MTPAPTTPKIQKLRAHRRYVTYLDATIDAGYRAGKGVALSLSSAGLFVSTALPFPPGTRARVTIEVEDVGPVTLDALVIYRAVQMEHPGLGLRFLDADAGTHAVEAVATWHAALPGLERLSA